jgi:hypothetical protein
MKAITEKQLIILYNYKHSFFNIIIQHSKSILITALIESLFNINNVLIVSSFTINKNVDILTSH